MAVTAGPGLIGALLVGLSTAKALAAARRLPLIPVDHLQGHVAASFLEPDPIEPPFLCLVASGGHTLLAAVSDHAGHEVLGQTLDDAAGECIDKGARLLGLGMPGGPALERLARDGDPAAFEFPVAMSPRPRPRLLLQRAQDRPRLPLPRARARRRGRAGRGPRGRLPGGGRRAARREARPGPEADGARDGLARRRRRGQRAAAQPRGRGLRGTRGAAEARAPGAVHGQRGDDRVRGAVRARASTTRPTWTTTPSPRAGARRLDGSGRGPASTAGRTATCATRRAQRSAASRRSAAGTSSCVRSTSRATMSSSSATWRGSLWSVVEGDVVSELLLDSDALIRRIATVAADG